MRVTAMVWQADADVAADVADGEFEVVTVPHNSPTSPDNVTAEATAGPAPAPAAGARQHRSTPDVARESDRPGHFVSGASYRRYIVPKSDL